MRRARFVQGVFGVCIGVVLGSMGCWDRNESERGTVRGTSEQQRRSSRRAASEFLEAVQYRDLDGAWQRHIASTGAGVYCRSEAFRNVLERTKEQKTEQDCRDVRSFGPSRRAALEEDAELLVQILRFTCEMPEGTCVDYARKVFETQLPKSDFWAGVANFEISKVRAEGGEADVYVDYWRGERSSAEVERRTLEVKRHDGSWYVTDQFGASDSAR